MGLHKQIYQLFRSKTIKNDLLKISCPAIDAKTIYFGSKDVSSFAQRIRHVNGERSYHLRILRAVQTSSIFRPCIDQVPVPSGTNEKAMLREFFNELIERNRNRAWHELFTMPRGFCSLENASKIDRCGYAYLFGVGNLSELLRAAKDILLALTRG